MRSTARLDLRLDAENKAAITEAAALSGLSVSTFIRNAAMRAAAKVIAGETAGPAAAIARRRIAAQDGSWRRKREAAVATRKGGGVKTRGRSLSSRLRGCATTRLSTDEIMRLTRRA